MTTTMCLMMMMMMVMMVIMMVMMIVMKVMMMVMIDIVFPGATRQAQDVSKVDGERETCLETLLVSTSCNTSLD